MILFILIISILIILSKQEPFDCSSLNTTRLDPSFESGLFWDNFKCVKCNNKCTCSSYDNLCTGCITDY